MSYWVATLSIGESSFMGRFHDRESAVVWMRGELTNQLEVVVELPQVFGEINETKYTLNVSIADSKENYPCVKGTHPFCKENCEDRDEGCEGSSPWRFECDKLVSCTFVESLEEESHPQEYAFAEENMDFYTPEETCSTPLSKELRAFLESLTVTLVKFGAHMDLQKNVLGLPFAKEDFLNSPDLSKLLESLGTQDSLRAEIISLLAKV